MLFELEGIKISSLWFCDDTTLIANSVEMAKANIEIIKDVSGEFGLQVNENKSKALVYGNGGGVRVAQVGVVKVVNKITYLGLARVHNREETYREGAINSPKIFDWSKIHATLQI